MRPRRPDLGQQVRRDIAAAKADLRSRCDQTVSDMEERLRLLGEMSQAVENGSLDPKTAEGRLRQLVNERSSARSTRAGRTRIGLNAPVHRPPVQQPAAQPRLGPSRAMVRSAVGKSIETLDGRVVGLLLDATDSSSRRQVRWEVSLLLHLRRGLQMHREELVDDVVMLSSVMEFVEEVEGALSDLGAGGSARLERLLGYCRQLASQLAVLGGDVSSVKAELKAERLRLRSPDANIETIAAQGLKAFEDLLGRLEKTSPSTERNMLEDVLSLPLAGGAS